MEGIRQTVGKGVKRVLLGTREAEIAGVPGFWCWPSKMGQETSLRTVLSVPHGPTIR